jgi:hypothetical protein
MGAHENPRAEAADIREARRIVQDRRVEMFRLYIDPIDAELRRLSERERELVATTYGIELPHVVLGGWPCPDSITGHCVYDGAEDPSHDDCVVCHDPSERK